MGEPLLDVTFEASPDDFIAFTQHLAGEGELYRSQMQRTRKSVLGIVVISAVLLAILLAPDWSPLAMLVILVVGFAVAIVVWFTWPRTWRRQLRQVAERQVAMENPLVISGLKRYIFDDESVRYSGAHSGGYVTWPAIMRVTSDSAALYLHVSQSSAHTIPKRAFASDEAFGAAGELALRLWSEARRAAS